MADTATTDQANARRVARTKKALGLQSDMDLARFVETQHPRICYWKSKGFPKTTAIIIDAFLDKLEALERTN
jgi:hypothetical protein